jgi:hypothetical protein
VEERGDLVKQLRKSKRSGAAIIVQHAETDQRLLDIAARADARQGIRQGLADAKKGTMRPVREFFAEFEARHRLVAR